MRRRDTVVRPTNIANMTVAVALLAALAACASGPKAQAGARSSDGARMTTRPVSATSKAVPHASATPVRQPVRQPVLRSATPKPAALPVGAANVGTLPQTSALPNLTSRAFTSAVHDIWLAVTTGDPDYALPAFFPEKAYGQVKAIADPQADWQGRLWYDFTLDVAAVHKLVGANATFAEVLPATRYEQWIPTGACSNSIGYWHLPGSRVVYREGGVTRSFGIASFISWRGDWYVIHLGALVRSGTYGIVDDPETGPGIPGPPGGC